MKKATFNKLALVVSVILIAVFILSACDSPDPRIPIKYTFNPGGQFSTNVNDEDPRRQIRCTIIFEVVDEAAVDELTENSFVVRSAVLSVLAKLTIPEITTNSNLDAIAERLIEKVNEDLQSTYDLVIGAYFTDFALV
ncbi:MAG: flagellar basal body-associated FliL family protein [Oscillospiraceae bacterium]|nr:flagellar basal body-associated FliL family protein [Oscillospiraceae bacterium]